MDIDQNAPVITREEITVNAPVETLWKLHTDVNHWTDWNKDIASSKLKSPLAVGAVFRWETAGLTIDSTVGEIVPQKRIAWSGTTEGITKIHVWHFEPSVQGTLVKTEESWSGEPVQKRTAAMQKGLDESLRSWLKNLKREAENRSG